LNQANKSRAVGTDQADSFSWNNHALDGSVSTISRFSHWEGDALMFPVFDSTLTSAQRQQFVSLQQQGNNLVLQLNDHQQRGLKTVVLEGNHWLQDSGKSAEQLLQLLLQRGTVQLLDGGENAVVVAVPAAPVTPDISPVIIRGSETDDYLRPKDLFDLRAHRMDSGAGNDVLLGSSGDDLLHGGSGSDQLYGAAGHNTFLWYSRDLGGYTDTVFDFSSTRDCLQFSSFDPRLTLDQRQALMHLEQDGNNSLLSMKNQQGQVVQTVRLMQCNLLLDEQGGVLSSADALAALSARGILKLEIDTDYYAPLLGVSGDGRYLRGGEWQDLLMGNQRAELLSGGAGGDILQGNGGDDVLNGGAGSDILLGGAGKDRFFWASQDLHAGDTDIVGDFVLGEDVLIFDLSGFPVPSAGTEPTLRLSLLQSGRDGLLELSDQGSGNVLQTVVLENTRVLDFNGVTQSSTEALARLIGIGALVFD